MKFFEKTLIHVTIKNTFVMNKFHVITFLGILAIFAGILSVTQKESVASIFGTTEKKSVLPPDADTFQVMPTGQQAQKEQPQQQEPASVQGDQSGVAPTYGVEGGMQASYAATIKTTKGNITVVLFGDIAPRTVKNFLEKADKGFYKGLTFHRVEEWVVQGGDPKGDGTGGGQLLTELSRQPFVAGSLGVARGGNIQISNDSQFFIAKSNAAWLDQQYTNFGIVTEGMDVVNSITKGDKILGITPIKN